MKSSFALLAVGAAVAAAQDVSSLPQCGQTCINNMLNIAQGSFGCGAGDIVCYCTEPNFGYGVRDCSNQACSDPADAAKVIAYGTAFCQQFLASAGASASGAISTGALGVLTSALATASDASALLSSASGVVASATESGAGALSTAITTSPLVATVVSGDQTQLQTTGFATLYSSLTGSAGSAIASATDSAGSVIASATESAASAASSAASSAESAASSAASSAESAVSSAASSLASAASSLASAANSAVSTGGAPMMTGIPLAGAAGMAALFLL